MKKTDFMRKLSKIDDFPVDFAGRDGKGDLLLTASVFRVKRPPSPMFGQNIKAFGFDRAISISEKEFSEGGVPHHDFGACFVRPRSLRKERDGKWYVDLNVDPSMCRRVTVGRVLVDSSGDRILKDGKPQVRWEKARELWITVPLSDIEPDASHPLCDLYMQRDRHVSSQIKANSRIENMKIHATSRGRTMRVRFPGTPQKEQP